ncbi:MAG TPA: enoyl-CoA hydratase/isomerase family protein [Acidimicrobiales bacterium]
MECEAIEFEVGSDHVATITLNRPEVHNAWNDRMAGEISWAWETIRDDDGIHAVVLRANGEKAFCTGADVRGGTTWFFSSNVWNTFDPGRTLSPKAHHRCWKPVVVAVHGMCAGGAQYFLNEADIIIASEDATFFDPHANAGIVSALEPIGMLHRGVPLGDVLRWALMGNEERITAATALRLGLVTEVVPREQLRDRAASIAASIAARNPRAVQGSVRAIWESLDMTRSIALQNGMAYTTIGNHPRPEGPTGPPPGDGGPAFR